MVPDNSVKEEYSFNTMDTKTYNLDFDRKRICGYVYGNDAIKQAIRKAIETKRYAFEIYDWDYGSQLHELIGRKINWAEALAEAYIEDSLIPDSRIDGIRNFSCIRDGSSLRVNFDAVTNNGVIGIEMEAEA
ncbi:DUF2634 domain-containing protein [Lachnospiraceae bacterium NSJ-143]|nr:DUF2634 domain-containing protein [Lachnospiraceae bacterium NSJ-143]